MIAIIIQLAVVYLGALFLRQIVHVTHSAKLKLTANANGRVWTLQATLSFSFLFEGRRESTTFSRLESRSIWLLLSLFVCACF